MPKSMKVLTVGQAIAGSVRLSGLDPSDPFKR